MTFFELILLGWAINFLHMIIIMIAYGIHAIIADFKDPVNYIKEMNIITDNVNTWIKLKEELKNQKKNHFVQQDFFGFIPYSGIVLLLIASWKISQNGFNYNLHEIYIKRIQELEKRL